MLGAVLPNASTTQPMPDGAVLVRSDADLREAIRERIEELQTTYDGLDQAAGLPDRFVSKLLSEPPMRGISASVLWLILPALGYDISLIPNEELLAKRRGLLTKRRLWFHPPTMQAIARRRLLPWLFNSEKAKEMGHLGGCARAAKLHANAARSEVRRKAAFKRWRHRPVKTSQSNPVAMVAICRGGRREPSGPCLA
jgi:hypothetical protein